MADPYSGATGTTKQEANILSEVKQRQKTKGQTITKVEAEDSKGKGKGGKKKEPSTNLATLYKAGIKLLELNGYYAELSESGPHVNHTIRRPMSPPDIKGIDCPHSFNPLQEIFEESDLQKIDEVFNEGICGAEVREFWTPFFKPQVGESALSVFTSRMLKMKSVRRSREIHEVMELGHSFDPAGRLGNDPAFNPIVWVPDRAWFKPELQKLTFADVFTIFPPAEQELLKLIIGRIGVGRTNHLPPGWKDPVKHTARMAAVIVGKDPGLGKSTIFNGMMAAFSKCGFITHTFKDVDKQFGVKAAALSNIA